MFFCNQSSVFWRHKQHVAPLMCTLSLVNLLSEHIECLEHKWCNRTNPLGHKRYNWIYLLEHKCRKRTYLFWSKNWYINIWYSLTWAFRHLCFKGYDIVCHFCSRGYDLLCHLCSKPWMGNLSPAFSIMILPEPRENTISFIT